MIDKIKFSSEFEKEYEVVSETERNEFSRLENKFLKDTFIIKEKESDTKDYYKILGNKNLFLNYFGIIDYELCHDVSNGIFYIKTMQDRNRITLYKFDTVLLLILRKLFYIKSKEISSDNRVIVTVDEIMNQMRISQMYKDDKKATVYDNSLRLFRRYKIIDFSSSKINENTVIEIYPTIQIVVTQENIEDLTLRMNALKKDDGGMDYEETDED